MGDVVSLIVQFEPEGAARMAVGEGETLGGRTAAGAAGATTTGEAIAGAVASSGPVGLSGFGTEAGLVSSWLADFCGEMALETSVETDDSVTPSETWSRHSSCAARAF